MDSTFFFGGARLCLSACLDALLPRSCILCGRALPPAPDSPPWPVCAHCVSRLRPWAGERCPSCGLPLISETGRCMRCRGVERAFESAYPLFSYEGPVRELVSAYKKGRRRSLSHLFAFLLAETIEERWPGRTVVPVPPRPGKLRAQGWDQVEEIARILEARGINVERPLERGASVEQKRLGRGARGANARKAYSLKAGALSPELPILLDDVVTTCATLEACARALKEGGAAAVEAVVLAAD
jgi:competence protein ComFC